MDHHSQLPLALDTREIPKLGQMESRLLLESPCHAWETHFCRAAKSLFQVESIFFLSFCSIESGPMLLVM